MFVLKCIEVSLIAAINSSQVPSDSACLSCELSAVGVKPAEVSIDGTDRFGLAGAREQQMAPTDLPSIR